MCVWLSVDVSVSVVVEVEVPASTAAVVTVLVANQWAAVKLFGHGQSVQAQLRLLLDANAVLVGHSLENDLRALKMYHHRVIDTVTLFPHPRGPPFRYASAAMSACRCND